MFRKLVLSDKLNRLLPFLGETLEGIHENARNNLNHNFNKMKTSCDKFTTENIIVQGDLALMFNLQRKKGIRSKRT